MSVGLLEDELNRRITVLSWKSSALTASGSAIQAPVGPAERAAPEALGRATLSSRADGRNLELFVGVFLGNLRGL
jgi:hypothetical protein